MDWCHVGVTIPKGDPKKGPVSKLSQSFSRYGHSEHHWWNVSYLSLFSIYRMIVLNETGLSRHPGLSFCLLRRLAEIQVGIRGRGGHSDMGMGQT
jgi:hypothetical protein